MQRKEEKPKKKLKYDPAEGLLPEIRRICGFPKHIDEISPRSAAKKKKIVEEEWSMPEAQNCGMCSSGGDILCCETCPASFHLSCLGIDESDVPEGNFYCNRCQKFPRDKPRLFPPEKCCPSTSPLIRVGNENKRNEETIGWHYERLREEAGVSGQPRSYPGGVLPEGEEERMFSRCFPDPQLLQALAMANPTHFVLPPEYLKDRHFKPGDALDDKRPQLCGERCTKCQLRDEWSPQLRCDFCHQIWHQKCVEPPLINIPRHNYWQCPNHTESLMEMIWQGEEIKRDEKTSICRKYQKMERYMDGEQIFMTFARKCANLRVLDSISRELSSNSEVFQPERCKIDVKMAFSPRKGRKGGRGKKKCDSRFLLNTFQFTFSPEKTEKTDKIERRKSPEKDRELEKLDKKRSIKFTDEELIMSIMPFDEKAREEYVSEKMAGLDVEMAAGFYQRHQAMVERSRSFQTNFTEKDVLKQMRKDLDPVSSIRSSGTQSIADYQERNVRKKIKTEVEVLIRHIGLGNCDRQFSSPHTESFFRRQAPPTLPTEHLNSGSLLEVCMNSRKEALEHSRVFHYHKAPEDLSKLVLLGYSQVFGSRETRDNYFASSMSIWSKEPILAVLAKYQEEHDMEVKKENEKVEESDEEEEDVEKSSEKVLAQEEEEDDDEDMVEEAPRSEEAKVEELDEGEDVETLEEADAPPQAANESGPLEVENPVEEEIEQITQKLAKCKVRIFEKAESVYNAEGYFGEPDYYEYFDEPRKWKSLDDLEEWIDWGATQKTLQNYILMHTEESFNPDHNYASLNPPEEEPVLFRLHEPLIPPPKPVVPVEKPKKEAKKYEEINIPQPILDAIKREHSQPTEGRKRAAKAVKEIGRVDEPPIQKKRGRPLGSKNRKEGEERTPRKRQSTGTPRGRGGRGRGSRGGRGRGMSSRRQSDISTTNSALFPSSEDVSRDGDFFMSPDAPSTSDTPPTTSSLASPPSTGRLREIVEETRQKYAKLMIARSLEQEKESFFSTRDSALETWTSSDWRFLKERCQMDRLQSLIPYDTRYFLPTQRVCAKLEIPGHLPIAIQRGLTKIGTARDCHVRLDRLTEHFCSFLADYHFDIIREYHSNAFYLSTLATESVFVSGVMVQRPDLTPFEAAEKMRMEGPSPPPNHLKCRCEQESAQDSAHQLNSGKCVTSGILRLRNGSRIRVGCAEMQFFITN